jgi:hypothetical protein
MVENKGTFSKTILPVALCDRIVSAIRKCTRRVRSNDSRKELLWCELDSHADTCLVGRNFVMVDEPERTVNVHAYSDEIKPFNNIPICSAATLWVDSQYGKSYILKVHECLFFGDRMDSSLLNPNQMRHHGIVVDDVPRQYDRSSTHSIYCPEDEVRIPLALNGVISGFETQCPTREELDTLPVIALTSNLPWNPDSKHFALDEARCAATRHKEFGPGTFRSKGRYQRLELMNA